MDLSGLRRAASRPCRSCGARALLPPVLRGGLPAAVPAMGHAGNLPNAAGGHASSHEGYGDQKRGNLPLSHVTGTRLDPGGTSNTCGAGGGGQEQGDLDAGSCDDEIPRGRALREDAGAGWREEGDSGPDGGRDRGADGPVAHHTA